VDARGRLTIDYEDAERHRSNIDDCRRSGGIQIQAADPPQSSPVHGGFQTAFEIIRTAEEIGCGI
jgi:hypothetical protein